MQLLLADAGKPHFFSMDHLHALLNHLPIIGLAMGLLALALALWFRSRKAEVVGTILVLIAATSAWPVVFTGQRAYKDVRGMTDDAGTDWLDTHMERAEKAAPALYALAALAAATLLVPLKWPVRARPFCYATLALGTLCLGASGWIADAGGKIRHPEFRSGEPPASEPKEPHTH